MASMSWIFVSDPRMRENLMGNNGPTFNIASRAREVGKGENHVKFNVKPILFHFFGAMKENYIIEIS